MKRTAPAALLVLAMALVIYAFLATRDSTLPLRGAPPPPGLCVLSGIVLDENGIPLADVHVSARILEPGDAFTAGARTDRAGRFSARLFPARGLWGVRAEPEDGPPIRLDLPVAASRDGRLEVTLQRTLESRPKQVIEPNLAGQVSDSAGRTQTGIPVVALDPGGKLLARSVSDETGSFAMRVEVQAPVDVRIEGAPAGVIVNPIPHLDIVLFRERRDDERGDVTVQANFLGSFDDEIVEIALYGSTGSLDHVSRVNLADRSWRLADITHGAYDVRIRGATVSGAIQGFDFTPVNYLAVVPVGRGGVLKGRLNRDARVVLVSDSPTWVPLTVESANTHGYEEIFPGVFADSSIGSGPTAKDLEKVFGKGHSVKLPASDRLSAEHEFEFVGIPAGMFKLRAFRPGFETIEIPLELGVGEVMDLGEIELPVATGSVSIKVTDRVGEDGSDGLEFEYLVSIYSHASGRIERRIGPGRKNQASFSAVAAGNWFYRVQRVLGEGHLRHIGRDHAITVKEGEELKIEVDCTWRF